MFGLSTQNSINKRLVGVISNILAATIFILLLISTFSDFVAARAHALSDLTVLAEVAARNSASTLLFSDEESANEIVSALQAQHQVRHAVLLDAKGVEFAVYNRQDDGVFAQDFVPTLFNHEQIIVPVKWNGDTLGHLRVESDLHDMWQGVLGRWLVNLAGLMLAFSLARAYVRYSTKNILRPITSLVAAAREIIHDQKYSLRVEKTSDDELGELTIEFNQMLAQIELRDSELRLTSEALAQTQDAIVLRDANLQIRYVNPAFTSMFGYSASDVIGKQLSLMPARGEQPEISVEAIYAKARKEGVYRGESSLETKQGKVIPVSVQISPVRNDAWELCNYVSVFTDITEKKLNEQKMWQQANFDTLTGLPNRRMFHERLQQEIQRTNRTKVPFVLMFLDLDNFKEVNDSLGHDAGDELLKQTAQRLVDCVRESDSVGYVDTVSRLGGDEFTILINDLRHDDHVESIVTRILSSLAEPYQLRGESVYISASIGVTFYPKDGEDAETLLKNADQTMYQSKAKGRNTYSYFSQAMQQAAQKRRTMISDMRVAIEQQQFTVVYQPIVDLNSHKVFKAEALVRWQHPTFGTVQPGDFIPLAEETGMIVDIGNLVFNQVAEQLAVWRQTIHPDFQISINKSPVQFLSKRSDCEQWFQVMQKLGLVGSSLIIEITEGLMLEENTLVSDKLLAFRDAGVQVAVDDFGTGYSSLSYLKKFDIDFLKIDKSFVQNLSARSEDMVLCEAIILMARKMGLEVIAEGIETNEQKELLLKAGCDFGQGYLFARPESADNFERLFAPKSVKSSLLGLEDDTTTGKQVA